MKLLNAAQTREWDQYTIDNEPVSSIHLMERAAMACTNSIISRQPLEKTIRVFCGKGNNGGDGLAIARLLLAQDIQPVVYILEFGSKGTADFQKNLQALHRLTKDIHFIQSEDLFPAIASTDLVVDALFGSGINRPLEGLSAALVQHINGAGACVICIDLPSGMFPDRSSQGNTMIKADATLTFQRQKPCLLVAENSEYFGRVQVLDIGLHPGFEKACTTDYFLTGAVEAAQLYRPRKPFSHKGDYGHALIIGGSSGKCGAALIATEACLRSGAGLVSAHLLSGDYTALNSICPEAMTVAGNEMVKQYLPRYQAAGLGPGMGTDDIALHILTLFLRNFTSPLVIDADGLNLLAQQPEWQHLLPPGTILTPHPGEFDRLFGKHPGSFDRFDTALKFSARSGCVLVLKGHHTLVAAEGRGYFNTTGNAGLAKGGSGDALTGILTALLAQGYPPLSAAKLGVYIHGLSAGLALESQSTESMLASDCIRQLGPAFKLLLNVG